MVYLLKIYIDDQNVACEALPPGSRLVDGKVIIEDSEVESDMAIPSDIRTSKILLEIANSVSPFIVLTADAPSNNPSGFMPLLDLRVRVEENRIIHLFYKKEVSNPLLITKNSAMPFRTKRASLSCEALRRLRNCSRDLPWEQKAEILSEFSHKLMLSGWDAGARYDFIMAGLTGYHKQLERADAGICPLYRPWDWDREARDRKKLLTKTSWYRPRDAVMFVPATPNSELRNKIQSVVDNKTQELKMSLRVVETSGKKVKHSLVNLDLTGCFYGPERCQACKSGLKGSSHTRSGVQYYITCKVCAVTNILVEYHGESGDNAVHRLGQHGDAIERKDKKNAMAKHLDIYHPDNIGDPDCFDYSSVATFKKRLERQISEGVAIMKTDERVQENRQQHILMNSKREHKSLQPAIHRQVTVRGVRNGS